MSRLWRWLLPAYVWALPMSLFGILIGLVAYRAYAWRWYDGVLTCVGGVNDDGTTRIWGRPNAQTLGWVQFYDSSEMRELANLRVHENVHVVQAFAGGLVGVALFPLLFMAVGWSPLWGLVLGGPLGSLLFFSALYAALFYYLRWKLGGPDWYAAYRRIPFEVQAYDLQDAYVADVEAGKNPRPWGV